ncbi:hypothetical protein GBF38_004999 [Nibea albiflora]|uniref:Uncharacterized protein n=1 Tax=Nibea albiflora TaxID=240163 RepID=A0ACB7EUN0_NIBAL|nr:hypothetical protein GBF38_004999 [Nibea albiflora]
MPTRLKVTPTWYLSVGNTVQINCTTTNTSEYKDKIDLQLVWTKMGPGERTKQVLVSQRASTGISYVLGPVTHEHQGVYTCDDDGSLPDIFVHDWHSFIWVEDASPRASIDLISHNRIQFAHGENFTVSCQLPDDNSQWKMMRNDVWTGNITECPNQVSSGRNLSCTSRSQYPWTDYVYWCESSTGERSNALNITTTIAVKAVLESPSLPVLEGEDVVLRCLTRDNTSKPFTPSSEAIFYKDDGTKWILTEGTLTLTAVTKANEGFYECKKPLGEKSDKSWLSVTVRPKEDQKEKSDTETS